MWNAAPYAPLVGWPGMRELRVLVAFEGQWPSKRARALSMRSNELTRPGKAGAARCWLHLMSTMDLNEVGGASRPQLVFFCFLVVLNCSKSRQYTQGCASFVFIQVHEEPHRHDAAEFRHTRLHSRHLDVECARGYCFRLQQPACHFDQTRLLRKTGGLALHVL